MVLHKFSLEPKTLITAILKEYGISSDAYYLDILTKISDKMLSGGYPQQEHEADLFSVLKNSSDISTETKFAYKKDDNIYLGIIDLIYKYKGQWYIVDYKTNFEALNLEELYNKQLQSYKDAFKENMKEEAISYIYHIEV